MSPKPRELDRACVHSHPHSGATVELDGEPVRACLWANVLTGEVRRFKTDEDGRVIRSRDEAARETVTGAVVIYELLPAVREPCEEPCG